MKPPLDATLIGQAHALYCRLTGQSLSLRYDRERLWYEVLRAGHTLADVEHLIRYLQREIRATRRQVGALKLSNLLQPDRFEEDLGISRLQLRPPPARPRPNPPPPPRVTVPPAELEARRLRGLEMLAELRRQLR
jgi:hypothetical protein